MAVIVTPEGNVKYCKCEAPIVAEMYADCEVKAEITNK